MLTVSRLCCVVVLGVSLLFLMASSVLATDNTPKSTMASMAVTVSTPIPASACPRLHTINPNETRLVQITDWYGLDLATVAALSGIPADAPLTTGDMVCLAAPAARTPTPRSVPASACPRLHTINPNETRLVQITDWHGLDLATVAALNGMQADAPLTTGSMICLSATEQTRQMVIDKPAMMDEKPPATSPPETPDMMADKTDASTQSDGEQITGSMDPEAMAEASRKRFCNSLEFQAAKENCWWRLQNNQEIGWLSELGSPDNFRLTFWTTVKTNRLPLILNQDLGGAVFPVFDGQRQEPAWAWGYSPFPFHEWLVSTPFHDLAILASLARIGHDRSAEPPPLVPYVCVKPDRAINRWICILDKDM